MAAAKNRRSLAIEPPNPSGQDIPPIAAAFLIHFDLKIGYTIAWKKSISGVELDGVVEYKSLPSGLHTTKQDLVYFVHDNYAGISAFVNEPAGEEDRNAVMVAVGVLVPLTNGRLGRCWRHAQNLKALGRIVASDIRNTDPLEEFWEQYRLRDESSSFQDESPINSPSGLKFKSPPRNNGYGRTRSVSDGGALGAPGQVLSEYHPSLSLPLLLDAFGPLLFPIYRAALLRKRILILGPAPVETMCNFVYDISILSTIPASVTDGLGCPDTLARLRPLFSVGVHDIPFLEQERKGESHPPHSDITESSRKSAGWVACSTDEILATKAHVYDLLIRMPSSPSKSEKKVWPDVVYAKKVEVKATQRDLRRYRRLRQSLRRFQSEEPASGYRDLEEAEDLSDQDVGTDEAHLLPRDDRILVEEEPVDDRIIEPISWTALAYASFMWWASAGEKRADLDDESEHDDSLLTDLSAIEHSAPLRPQPSEPLDNTGPRTTAAFEMVMIAYFHRLTTLMLSALEGMIDATEPDREHEEEDDGEPIFVSSDDAAKIGLDVWSENDSRFVEELVKVYFGRNAQAQRAKIECCGLAL